MLVLGHIWVPAPKTVKDKKQSQREVKAVRIDFTGKNSQNRERDSREDLGSIPNTTRTMGVYRQGAGLGVGGGRHWWMGNHKESVSLGWALVEAGGITWG